ncbi:MAG: 30S ribosomal protein S6 [Bacteroidetes bacterium]|nr:30S ribosomal protein S6 [Bacteroidota bacterium]
MARRYEVLFIMTPVLSDSQIKDTVKKYKKLLKDVNARVIHEENWGLRKLAYPIQKKSTGFYYLIEFEAEGSSIDSFEVAFNRDERIIRFLTSKMDKHAIAYAEKKRAKKAEVKEEPGSSASQPLKLASERGKATGDTRKEKEEEQQEQTETV